MSKYRMQKHTDNNYLYAATVSTVHNGGKRIRKYTHWGTLNRELVFTPNLKFIMSPREEREKFIFPPEWDISNARKLDDGAVRRSLAGTGTDGASTQGSGCHPDTEGAAKAGGDSPAPDGICASRHSDLLYGSVWFLLKIAELKHVVDDLMATFEHKKAVVDDILTLAIFPYLTRKNYDRLAHEQRITKYPSENVLTSAYITRFAQHITAQNRLDFCSLRIRRQPSGAFLACDSTTRSAWGRCIAEIHYGRNKDNKDMDCTLEVVVYSLTTHEPVYYRSFPGNMPDVRTVRTIVEDVRHMGADNLVTIYDRGYESSDNFDEFFREGIAFISCAKVAQEPVINCLMEITYDGQGLPTNMRYDPEERLYYAQFIIEGRTYADKDGSRAAVSSGDFRCNIFLDPSKRPFDLIDVNDRIQEELDMLEDKGDDGLLYAERDSINKKVRFHRVAFEKDPDTGQMVARISRNHEAIRKARAVCGFFSSVTYKAEGDALSMLRAYRTRDEQEKYFEQMKDQMGFHTQDCSSEDGKNGRDFILFVGLILSSTVRNTWKESLELRSDFRTSLSVLDEMADIRHIQYPDGTEHMTSFLARQVKICNAYGIDVPADSLPSAHKKANERKKAPKKRGPKPGVKSAPNKISVRPVE